MSKLHRIVLVLALLCPAVPHALAAPPAPRHVVLIVIDQCRADYLSRFPLPHIRQLLKRSAYFPEAWVGHLASETIVSHPVIATGRFPAHLPWCDEVYRDHRGLLGAREILYLSGSLTLEQMDRLFAADPGPPVLAELVRRRLGGRVYGIGEKSYAAYAMGADGCDSIITLSHPDKAGPWTGYVHPEGRAVPSWFAGLGALRFYVDSRNSYGTAGLEYPEKGDIFVPGSNPAHEGGDLWAANVAREIMHRDPDWRGLMITLAGVDRVGHMLGEFHGRADRGQDPSVHLDTLLASADAAVGRVLDGLSQSGQLEDTLVILTSDHGAQAGRFLGDAGPGRAYKNWYIGHTAQEDYHEPSKALAPLATVPGLEFAMCDTAMRLWMTDRSALSITRAAHAVAARPAVQEVFGLINGRYQLLVRNPSAAVGTSSYSVATPAGQARVASLLKSYASDQAGEVVGLLEDGVTYGAPGDHGGHQEECQRIPLLFAGPGVVPGVLSTQARLVDIVPTVAALLGLPVDPRYDGHRVF